MMLKYDDALTNRIGPNGEEWLVCGAKGS